MLWHDTRVTTCIHTVNPRVKLDQQILMVAQCITLSPFLASGVLVSRSDRCWSWQSKWTTEGVSGVTLVAIFGERHGGFTQSNEWTKYWKIYYHQDGDWNTTPCPAWWLDQTPSFCSVSLFKTLSLCGCPAIILIGWTWCLGWKYFSRPFKLDSAMPRQLCTSFFKAFSAKDVNLANARVSILLARYS